MPDLCLLLVQDLEIKIEFRGVNSYQLSPLQSFRTILENSNLNCNRYKLFLHFSLKGTEFLHKHKFYNLISLKPDISNLNHLILPNSQLKISNIELQRCRDQKIRVCGKTSVFLNNTFFVRQFIVFYMDFKKFFFGQEKYKIST